MYPPNFLSDFHFCCRQTKKDTDFSVPCLFCSVFSVFLLFFNVENAVAAIAAAWSMGIPVSLIKESLLGVTVPGRMETYESSAGEVTAIVHRQGKIFREIRSCHMEIEFSSARLDITHADYSIQPQKRYG